MEQIKENYIKCICKSLLSEDNFSVHHPNCKEFSSYFMEFDSTFNDILKKLSTQKENLVIIKYMLLKYAETVEKYIEKNKIRSQLEKEFIVQNKPIRNLKNNIEQINQLLSQVDEPKKQLEVVNKIHKQITRDKSEGKVWTECAEFGIKGSRQVMQDSEKEDNFFLFSRPYQKKPALNSRSRSKLSNNSSKDYSNTNQVAVKVCILCDRNIKDSKSFVKEADICNSCYEKAVTYNDRSEKFPNCKACNIPASKTVFLARIKLCLECFISMKAERKNPYWSCYSCYSKYILSDSWSFICCKLCNSKRNT